MSKQIPMLMESPLTKRVFVVTSYKDNGDGTFTARQKHDVTEEFDALAAMRQEGGDADYERRMDELLCRLTNGKWSKSRSYSVDFMVSCVDEAYEDATLGGGECEMQFEGNIEDTCGEHYVYLFGWTCSECGNRMTSMYEDDAPNFCPNCGKAVKR